MQARDSISTGNCTAVPALTSRRAAHWRRTNKVGFLTLSGPIRRLFDGVWKIAGPAVAGIFLLATGTLATTVQAMQWHPLADIEKTAEDYVRGIIGPSAKRTTLQAGRLDRRLQLAPCTQDLEAFQQRGAKINSRTVVGVRCNGSHPWKIYVPVDVIVAESVLVTRLPLPVGHIFSAGDVATETRDVSRLAGGYVSRFEALEGKRLKHALMAGRVITPSMLKADIMIRRGQSVTIVAQHQGVTIRMMGKALTDGTENQRIRVENTKSKRVVEGVVRSPEHVEVRVY